MQPFNTAETLTLLFQLTAIIISNFSIQFILFNGKEFELSVWEDIFPSFLFPPLILSTNNLFLVLFIPIVRVWRWPFLSSLLSLSPFLFFNVGGKLLPCPCGPLPLLSAPSLLPSLSLLLYFLPLSTCWCHCCTDSIVVFLLFYVSHYVTTLFLFHSLFTTPSLSLSFSEGYKTQPEEVWAKIHTSATQEHTRTEGRGNKRTSNIAVTRREFNWVGLVADLQHTYWSYILSPYTDRVTLTCCIPLSGPRGTQTHLGICVCGLSLGMSVSVSLWCEEEVQGQGAQQGQARGQSQLRAPWDPSVSGQRIIQRLLQVEERYLPSALYVALIQREPERREELAKWAMEVWTFILWIPFSSLFSPTLMSLVYCDEALIDSLLLVSLLGMLWVWLWRNSVSPVCLYVGPLPVCLPVSPCLTLLPGCSLHPHRLQTNRVWHNLCWLSLCCSWVQLPALQHTGRSPFWYRGETLSKLCMWQYGGPCECKPSLYYYALYSVGYIYTKWKCFYT